MVLAGGVNTIALYEGYTPGHKAILDFHGKPSIVYTLDALAKSKVAKECVGIVGQEKEIKAALGNFQSEFIAEGGTLLESILNALKRYKNEDALLITNADIPLIKSEAVDEFAEKCFQAKSPWRENVFVSVIPKEKFSGKFQCVDKGLSRFRDVEVCHGNLFMANPSVLDNEDAIRRINTVYNARKSPVQSALATGLRVGLSYVLGVHLLHILTMHQMANIASARFGIGFIPIVSSYPEIAVDADEPADYQFICDRLDERKES